MAEIDRARIKSIYAQIRGYYDNLPEFDKTNPYSVDMRTVVHYHSLLDQLGVVARDNYEHYKIGTHEILYKRYDVRAVKSSMGAVVAKLRTDFGFDEQQQNVHPAIFINNQNTNTIDIKINFTIENLIENAETDEEKENLQTIAEEIRKPNADWGRLKNALGWIINYSKDLSLKVTPIILDYYLKRGG